MSCSFEPRPCSSTTSGAAGSVAPAVATTGAANVAAVTARPPGRARRRCGRRPSGVPRRAGRGARPVPRLELAPAGLGQHPHHLELVAVRVAAVDALGGAVAGLPGVGVEVRQGEPGLLELLDGVDLPRQVVQPQGAVRAGRLLADPEQPEVVVVPGPGQPQEGGVRAGLARHHRHVEGLLVERDAALQVGHEQHGVVEADGVDGHRGLLSGGGVGAWRGQAATPKPPVQETFSSTASVSCRKPSASSSRARLSEPASTAFEAAGGDDAGQRGLGVGVVAGDQHGGGQRRRRCRRRAWRRRWC